jgi:hypothetical protein
LELVQFLYRSQFARYLSTIENRNQREDQVMKTTITTTAVAMTTISILVLAACASRKEAPDAVAVQEQISELRAQEIDLVRSTVLDDDRADRFIALLDKRDRLISRHVEEIVAYRKEISALNADYDAERESFNVLVSRYNNQRESAQREIVALIADMKKETTVDEWKIISKYQIKKVNPRQTTYSQTSGGV